MVIFLQRAADSRRVYAHVTHARANTDGHKGEGVTFPSGAVQKNLLQEVYSLAGVSPTDVSYVEAHGTGTKVRLYHCLCFAAAMVLILLLLHVPR